MRTLKKTLCLVLAMTMVLGFFGIASAKSASEYPDYDDVQYKEALGVMTGIDVIDGMGGELNPTGKVTRAQAAKMVTYAILGADVAEDLPVTASSFDDVNSYYDWAIPSIEYLVDRGIVYGRSGVGGNYDPEGEVTAYEVAKMMLCAAGYGVNDEYKGDSWALNVAIDARRNGVFTGTKAGNLNDPATREECALYCFNGLTEVNVVAYDKTIDDYSELKKEDKTYTLGDEVYGLEKTTAETNDKGYTGYCWKAPKISDKPITDYVLTDKVIGAYAAGAKLADIKEELEIETFDFYANGVAKPDRTFPDTVPYGASVTFVKTAEGNVKALATIEYIAEVKTVDNADKDEYEEVTFTVKDTTGGYDVDFQDDAKIAAGTYTKGELYVVVPYGDNTAADKFLSITPAEYTTGKITAKGDGYYRVNGDKANTAFFVSGVSNFNTTYNFYKLSDGSIAYVVAPAEDPTTPEPVAPEYAYVLGADATYTAKSGDGVFTPVVPASATLKLQVAFPNGETKVVDYELFAAAEDAPATSFKIGDETTTIGDGEGETTPEEVESKFTKVIDNNKVVGIGWVPYTMEDGKITIAAATLSTAPVKLTKDSAAVDTDKFATSKTVLNTYVYDSYTKKAAVTTVKGIANFPSDTVNAIVTANDKGIVSVIDAFAADTSSTETTTNYAYYVGEGEEVADDTTLKGFYVNGEFVQYVVDSESTVTLEEDKVYDLTVNVEGKLTAAAEVSTVSGTVAYVDATYAMVGTTPLYFTDNTVVYDASNGEATTLAAEDNITYVADGTNLVAAWIVPESK